MFVCRVGMAAWAAKNGIFALRSKCSASVLPAACVPTAVQVHEYGTTESRSSDASRM